MFYSHGDAYFVNRVKIQYPLQPNARYAHKNISLSNVEKVRNHKPKPAEQREEKHGAKKVNSAEEEKVMYMDEAKGTALKGNEVGEQRKRTSCHERDSRLSIF